MKVEFGDNIVEPIIREQVAAAVASQLGDPEKLIQSLVASALDKKVDAHGKVSQYRSDNKVPFLEALAGRVIREAATAAVQKIVAEQQPVIQAAVEEHLRRAPKKTAAAIVSAFADGCGSRYTTKVDFTFAPRD